MTGSQGKTPILITGGSGQLAALVIQELFERGLKPADLIVTTRTPDRLAHLAERGVSVRAADHDQPETLAEAFRGATRMLLISSSAQAFLDGQRLDQHKAAIDAAVKAGVRHIFYTSGAHASPDNTADAHVEHWQTEEAVKASGLEWTILRHWEWPDYHLEFHWRGAIENGVFYTAIGDGRISHVTREDCAAADAGALVADDVAGRTFDIAGPQSLGAEDIRRALAHVSGRPVELCNMDEAQTRARLIEAGTPPVLARVFAMVGNAVSQGWYDSDSSDTQLLSGRPSTTLESYLAGVLPDLFARPPLKLSASGDTTGD